MEDLNLKFTQLRQSLGNKFYFKADTNSVKEKVTYIVERVELVNLCAKKVEYNNSLKLRVVIL